MDVSVDDCGYLGVWKRFPMKFAADSIIELQKLADFLSSFINNQVRNYLSWIKLNQIQLLYVNLKSVLKI